jgi:hypothetical protein
MSLLSGGDKKDDSKGKGLIGIVGSLLKIGGGKAALAGGTAATGGTAALAAGTAATGGALLPILAGVAAVAGIASLFKKKQQAPIPQASSTISTSAAGSAQDFGGGRVVFEISGTNLIGVLNRAGAKLTEIRTMSYNQRYYFTFYSDRDTRIVNAIPDEYLCSISQLDYAGAITEIQAQENPIQINYQNTSSNKLEPIIGSECTLNLIATEDFQLEDLYTENEREFLVEVYRNGGLIWQGFIIPDGCQESFTFPPYVISVNAVDGIGLLKNLSYVQNDGNFYLGKQTFIEVIQACLVRLEAPPLFLNTCVNIYEDSMTQGDTYDPLDQCYVNSERYLKDDQFTPMNCEEVLRSILEEWTAVMIQSSGEWYIYRPTELAVNGTLVFRRYLEGFRVYDQDTLTENLDLVLGGESEGIIAAPYFHINTDQMKMIDRPYKNASMSYKYGENQNPDQELANPTLAGAGQTCGDDPIGPCDDVTIPGYTKTGTMYAGLYPTGGVVFYSDEGTYPTLANYYENNNTIPIDNGQRLRLVIEYKNLDPDFTTDMNFVISLYDGLDTYYLQSEGAWIVSATELAYTSRSEAGVGGTLEILSSIVPITGLFTKSVTFKILAPSGTVHDIVYTNISGFVLIDFGDVVGEIHTATQTGKFTFVPDTIDVFNGDSISSIYMGAIYGPDQTTLTTLWNRRGISESILALPYAVSKEFLRIAVEEKQRLYAGPFVRFEGSIFGYFNPVTRWSINSIDGYFMNLSLNYDLQQNICKAVLGRVVNAEIALDYLKIVDYGATTRVTVKGTP